LLVTVKLKVHLIGYAKTVGVSEYLKNEIRMCLHNLFAGTSWGEQGYIRILRGSDTCGIAVYVSQVA